MEKIPSSTNMAAALTMMLTRYGLARRWHTSTRTVDRRRMTGLLPWIDLAAGSGRRPQVRFRLADIEAYEKGSMQKAVCLNSYQSPINPSCPYAGRMSGHCSAL